MKDWLSVRQAADALGASVAAVYEAVGRGEIVHYRFGANRGSIRIKPSDLEAYVESRRVGPKVKPRPGPKRVAYVPKNFL
jgi:excisionase family DNA binding protein